MWIVITGNPISGFDFVGPFSDPATAIDCAERDLSSSEIDWWISKLKPTDYYEET